MDPRTAPQPKIKVTRILKGFEFGHGKISGVAAKTDVLNIVDKAIYNNPEILVPIDLDDDGSPIADDGCGDGRAVLTIFSLDKEYKRSLNRSKVFGGSATMATACSIGLGEGVGCSLNELFELSIKKLDHSGLDFGAHTDEHMHGQNCGCGAIDKAPQILFATLKYEIPIRGAVTILSDDTRGLNKVYGHFRHYVQSLASEPDYSGRRVMDKILNSNGNRIVKQLGGDHKECRIVLNTVRGFTVNQKLIRKLTDDEAQIFAVDVWRMQDIAQQLYDSEADRHEALISEIIYTVATAAVLTKGDLPVDLIEAV
jgi:hypothetical protein